tara:strand:+ start:455 stop:568 length:114 start_codon:yes stop_codon:yes gene_type:complete
MMNKLVSDSAHVSMERSPHGDKYGPENYGKGVVSPHK